MDAALRRGDLPFFPPSGFSIHHELFPVPSFWTRTKRLCSDRLCLMEFWKVERSTPWEKAGEGWTHLCACPFLQAPPRSNHYSPALARECKSNWTGGALKNTGFDSPVNDERGVSLRSLVSGHDMRYAHKHEKYYTRSNGLKCRAYLARGLFISSKQRDWFGNAAAHAAAALHLRKCV